MSHYVKATTLRLAAIGLNAVSALVLLPFILKSLGEYEFGLWGMATAISGYLLLLDFGIAQACTRYISLALEDKKVWVQTITNSLVVALLISIFMLGSIGIIQYLIHIQYFTEPLLWQVVSILLVEVAFSLPLRLYQSIMRAEVDYVALGWHEIIRIMLRVVGIPVLLALGFGLLPIVIYSAVVNSGFFALALFHVKRKHGQFFISTSTFLSKLSWELFHFGKYSLVTQAAEFFRYRVDNLIVGMLLGISSVAGFAIMIVLIDMLAQVQMRLQSYWDTIIMRELANKQYEKATQTMLKSLQLGIGFILVAMVNAYLFADVFLTVWVGEKYAMLVPSLVLFIAVLLSAAVQLSTSPYFNALGLQKLNAGLGLAEVLAKVILVFPLVLGWGINGIIYSTLVAGLVIGVGVRLYVLAPYTQLSFSSLMKRIAWSLEKVVLGLLLLLIVNYFLSIILNGLLLKLLLLGAEVIGISIFFILKKIPKSKGTLKAPLLN